MNADAVIILPNNKNIIMAAEQCVRLCEDKKVVSCLQDRAPGHRRHDGGWIPRWSRES